LTLWSQTLQFIFSGLGVGAIYALIALGFSIVYNSTGIVNFAQGEFVMLGALTAISLLGLAHLPLPLAFVCSVLVVTLVAALVERVAIRPLRDAGILVLIISTLAVSMVLRGGAMLVWGKDHVPMRPFSASETVHLGAVTILTQSLWVMAITVVVMGCLQLFYARTMLGKAMLATAFDREGAVLVGISPDTMVLLSFTLAGALGATAGILIAPIHMAAFNMGTMLGLKGFCAAVLGGLGSSVGGIAGGLALGVLESIGAGFAPAGFSGYRDAFAFAVLIIVLFARPTGIFGGSGRGKA
jgi:branched-chain amino acid transport system permease protein